MPKFTFTSPEGKTYDVQGPDGSTKEQAFGILQQQLGSAPKEPAAQIPDTAATAPKPRLAPAQETGPRTGGDILKGLGETALTVGSGTAAGLAGQVKGIAKGVTGGKYGTQAGVAEAADTANKFTQEHTYRPRTAAGQEYTQALGSAFDESKLAGMAPEGQAMGQIPKIPRAIATGGEALGTGTSKVGKTLSRVALSTLPAIDPETRALAREAHSMGFRLRPDQVYGSKYGKVAGELSSQVPFSGGGTDANQAIFNRNLLKTIGGEGDKLTRKAYSDAMKKSGGTIGDIAEKTNIPLNADFIGGLRQSSQEAAKFQTSDVAKVVDSYINEIINKSESGVLPGATLRAINTKLGNQIRSTANGDLKYALGDVQDTIQDAMKANLSKEDLAALNTARRQYAAGKTLESLVAKSPTGDVSPALLLGAITGNKAGKSLVAKGAAGDLGKLADIGQRFLKEPASSGTAERQLMQKVGAAGAVGGLAAYPAAIPGAAALYTGANLYNRYGPGITQSLLERPPK